MPASQPKPEYSKDTVPLFVSIPFAKQLEKECAKLNMSVEDFVRSAVEDRLLGGPGQVGGVWLALLTFASSIPFEVTIKVARGKKITYLWANDLFFKMAGLELKEIIGKTAREVWRSDPQRARRLNQLDRKVLKTGETVVHKDLIS